MTSESDPPVEESTKIRQHGGSEMSFGGNKLIGTVVLTDKNLIFIPAYGPKQVVALRSISRIESAREFLVLKSDESELARFGVYDRTEREAWVEDIKNARGLAEQRGESIQAELSAVMGEAASQWIYLAGNPNYPDSFATGLVLKSNGLALTGSTPPLLMPYQDIEGYELLPSKQLTATRIFLAGPLLASAWKKIEWFLCIRYKDDAGVSLSLVFEPISSNAVEEFMPALYKKLREARQGS
jgi:hypothetical protein